MAADLESHVFSSSSDETLSEKTSLSQELSTNDCNTALNEPDNDDTDLETKENIDDESHLTEYGSPNLLFTYSNSIETSKSTDTPNIIIATPDNDIDELILGTIDEKQSHSITDINNKIQKQFIEEHITNDPNYLFNKNFSEMDHTSILNIITKSHPKKITAISSNNGWNKGIHKFAFKILQGEVSYQEIGVVSVNENIHIDSRGITRSEHFGARAIFGNIRKRSLIVYGYIRKHKPFYPQEIINIINNFTCWYYYASYDNDGSERCFKYLSQNNNWKSGDVIGVQINLDKWNIKFYLNGEKVRKVMSLKRVPMYYPIIAFYGNCQYKLMHFE